MLFKIVFRAALVAGVLYGAKKVLDRTGATEKIVELGSHALDTVHGLALTAVGKVVDVLDDGLSFFAEDQHDDEEPQEAMTTPQAAQWHADNAGTKTETTGGSGGKW